MNSKNIFSSLKFIDTHTHGSFGVNFNYASYDDMKFVLKELKKRNIVAICPTLVGDANKNIQKQLSIFKKIREEQLNSFSKDEALILGTHLEGSFLNPEKSGIQDKNVFLEPTIENFKALVGDFIDIIKIVTIAPEKDVDLIDFLNEKNIKTQAGHTLGTSLKNVLGVTHIFNAMGSIHHRNPSIPLFALVQDEIYVEAICDLFHLSLETIKLIFKAKPLDKILLISDSLPSSNFDKEVIFCGKKLDKFGKDSSGTIAGSNLTLDTISKNLLEKNILMIDEIKQVAFYNQIKYLNISTKEYDILNR